MSDTNDLIVGIDLGTTFSLCAVLQAGKPVLLPNAVGELLTPSAVSVDDDGRMLVGAAARARAATHPEHTALAFKRDMGTDRLYTLGKHSFRPEQLSALVLAELKRDAEAALGRPIREAIVTVPAYFGDAQRQATRVAGDLAGLHVERIINEPTAAALAYGLHARDQEIRAIVLDLGGGTFDVTVLEIIEGVIEVQASAGDARLGGEDFADLLALEFERELLERHGVDVARDVVLKARVREAAEAAKRRLSLAAEATVALVGLATKQGTQDVELTITRARAEQIWQPLIERLRGPIARALRDASLLPSAVHEVLLVGGATRMGCVADMVAKTFGRVPNRTLPADEAVAMGAAVQAALKQGDQAVDDLIATDVAPFSLGIATATQFGQRHVAGIFSPIIERGTTIPVSRSERFATIEDNQKQIQVEVFQGEHSLCKDNTKLGEYTVKDLPRKPKGEAGVEVRFTYDLNGILEVEMQVVDSDKKHVVVIEQRPGALSPKQIEQARAAMKGLKFHPREALPNRTALARADALYAELTGVERAELGAVIAHLRAAIETQDPKEIEEARERAVRITEFVRGARR
ncbi:MAG: Hsp70 family protein [Myxococcales bacterium]